MLAGRRERQLDQPLLRRKSSQVLLAGRPLAVGPPELQLELEQFAQQRRLHALLGVRQKSLDPRTVPLSPRLLKTIADLHDALEVRQCLATEPGRGISSHGNDAPA